MNPIFANKTFDFQPPISPILLGKKDTPLKTGELGIRGQLVLQRPVKLGDRLNQNELWRMGFLAASGFFKDNYASESWINVPKTPEKPKYPRH